MGSLPRLQPGTAPQTLQIPPRGGHPVLRRATSTRRPVRHYPHFWIRCSPSEHRRDLNPPEPHAAQRTLWPRLTPAHASDVSRSPRVRRVTVAPSTRRIYAPVVRMTSRFECMCPLAHPGAPHLRFVLLGSELCLRLPSHEASPPRGWRDRGNHRSSPRGRLRRPSLGGSAVGGF